MSLAKDSIEERDVIVFIRTPFCVKEHEGDVFNAVHAGKTARAAYLDALEREINNSNDLFEGRRVRAIYVGGGIASVANPDKLARILLNFKRAVETVRGVELTLRLAPQTVGSPSLTALSACSYTRASLEVLATQDKLLEKIDAPQCVEDITDAIDFLNIFHVPRLDCELLYGIPTQSCTAIKNSIMAVTGGRAMGHITLRHYQGEGADTVSDDEQREQFAKAVATLDKEGLKPYTATSFARPGFECEYTYCEAHGMDRIGFGLGAQSFIDGMSYRNTSDYDTYIAHSDDFSQITCDIAEWSPKDLALRTASLGLARTSGLDLNALREQNAEVATSLMKLWDELCKEDLAYEEDGSIRPTVEGLRKADKIQQRIWQQQ